MNKSSQDSGDPFADLPTAAAQGFISADSSLDAEKVHGAERSQIAESNLYDRPCSEMSKRAARKMASKVSFPKAMAFVLVLMVIARAHLSLSPRLAAADLVLPNNYVSFVILPFATVAASVFAACLGYYLFNKLGAMTLGFVTLYVCFATLLSLQDARGLYSNKQTLIFLAAILMMAWWIFLTWVSISRQVHLWIKANRSSQSKTAINAVRQKASSRASIDQSRSNEQRTFSQENEGGIT